MSSGLPINELILQRGDAGLGFNIRGGTDIPHVPGDPGIFVTRLKEDGTAFKDGRLKEGDKILEVNGICIEQVTHNEAVQIFITAGNEVKMKVQHGAYAEIMGKLSQQGDKPMPASGGGSGKYIILALTILAAAGVAGFIIHRSQAAA